MESRVGLCEGLCFQSTCVSNFAKQIEVDPVYLKLVLDEQVSIKAELAEKIPSVITGPRPDTRFALQKDYDQ